MQASTIVRGAVTGIERYKIDSENSGINIWLDNPPDTDNQDTIGSIPSKISGAYDLFGVFQKYEKDFDSMELHCITVKGTGGATKLKCTNCIPYKANQGAPTDAKK